VRNLVENIPIIDCSCGIKNVMLTLLGPRSDDLEKKYEYLCPHCGKIYPQEIARQSCTVNYRYFRKRPQYQGKILRNTTYRRFRHEESPK
jgi:hypothetical protein